MEIFIVSENDNLDFEMYL